MAPDAAGRFRLGGEHVRAVAREFALPPAAADAALAMARRVVAGEAAWAWSEELLTDWGNEVELREQMARYRRALQTARPGHTVRLAFINAAGRLIELESP